MQKKVSRKKLNVNLMEYKVYQPRNSSRSQCGSDFFQKSNAALASPWLLGVYDILLFSTSSKFMFTPHGVWGGNEGGWGVESQAL